MWGISLATIIRLATFASVAGAIVAGFLYLKVHYYNDGFAACTAAVNANMAPQARAIR